jgi:hypothetical protein
MMVPDTVRIPAVERLQIATPDPPPLGFVIGKEVLPAIHWP